MALRAVTAMATCQIKEEKTRGTIEAGKFADFVILDQNPLKVESKAIKSISVVETLKEGRTIFRKAPSTASTADVPRAAVATAGCGCRVRPFLVPRFRPQAHRDALSQLAAAAAAALSGGRERS